MGANGAILGRFGAVWGGLGRFGLSAAGAAVGAHGGRFGRFGLSAAGAAVGAHGQGGFPQGGISSALQALLRADSLLR